MDRAGGQTTALELTLDAYGRHLLKARRRLPAMLTETARAHISERLNFIDKRSRNKKR